MSILKIKYNERLFLDRLRVEAILLVVIGHATRMFTTKSVFAELPSIPFFEVITDVIYSFHMPLFILLSGYVYGICIEKNNNYNTYLPFLKKKAQRLLVPYYFWGVFYVAPVMLLLALTPLSYFNYVKGGILLSTDCRHLWFLFTLFLIFAIVQTCRLCINRLVDNNKNRQRILFFSIILASVMPFINSLKEIQYFQVSSVLSYLVYFMVGLGLFYCQNKKTNWVGLVVCMAALFLGLKLTGFIAMAILAILCLFVPIDKVHGFVAVKKNGMGIYILHPMLLYSMYSLYDAQYSPYMFCILSIALVISISYVVCKLLQKLRVNVLLGE